ncbi:pyridoxal phosphate-dependent aminotransferase [Flavobacteriales bacterium]|jgi:aspartate aminotransferase|nr:pyridoxal phosphate-dependent aminotransferase [Flavobacteriales bacterium]MDA7578627.1 pyridoxal phosphate-dependent aminotransferase [Flavobacteriales bacterium]|tara:strand:- start:1690 stop:2886 length:1197 start_codon:yes stop_codon:yes gene_type:complete
MTKVSGRLNRLAESATLAMARMSRELQAKGVNIIALSLGEPDFDTPEFIKEAAKKAIDDNFSHYTPVPGLPELRSSISAKFKRDNHLEYTPDQIVVSTGAKQSLANVCLSLLDPEDEVLLPCPYWVSYAEIIKLAEGVPVEIKSTIDSDFKITPSQLEASITSRTKMIMFSSPCNPSGTVYTQSELEAIAKMLDKYPNIYIVSDEIYEHINFTDKHYSIGTIPSMKDRTVTVNGVSKGFAMTGWRVGFIGAPLWIAKACNKIQGQVTSATCAIAQKATERAMLAEPRSTTKEMKETFLKRRNMLVSLLKDIPGIKCNIPQGAFYVFPDISSYFGKSYANEVINNANDFCMYLLNFAHVACVAGDAFGNPECIRISYAASDKKLTDAVSRIKTHLAKLT